MAFLNRIFILLFVFICFQNNAQLNQPSKEAFIKSYHEEQLGLYEKAIASIQGIYSEKSYECNYRLGWLTYLQKKYTSSITYYKKAAANMPKSTEPLWAMVLPLSLTENWYGLNSTYLKILKLDSKNSIANYRVGLYNYYNKKYHTAKKYFSVVVNLYPSDFDALHMLGWTNYFLGNFEIAKSYFNRALIIQPSSESALSGLKLIK